MNLNNEVKKVVAGLPLQSVQHRSQSHAALPRIRERPSSATNSDMKQKAGNGMHFYRVQPSKSNFHFRFERDGGMS